MAPTSGAARLCLIACRRIAQQSRLPQSQAHLARRAFSTSPARWEDKKEPKPVEGQTTAAPTTPPPAAEPRSPDAPSPSLPKTAPENWSAESGQVEGAEGPELLDFAAKEQGYNTFDEYIEQHLRRGENAPVHAASERKLEEDLRRIDQGSRVDRTSFWYDEDDPETLTEEHDEFDENEITEMAHAKLEELKEMRHYERLAVWELPLLSSKTLQLLVLRCLQKY
jgi:small subunit ribosomal protein S35